jgi:hypothetical protein
MRSNGLESHEWTKQAIEWGFRKREHIKRKRGAFTPHEILSMINYFVQEEVLPKAETGAVVREMGDTSLLDEITQAMDNGKERQVFVDFGIPVTATYMVRIKGFSASVVEAGIRKLLQMLAAGGAIEREKLARIFQSSVVGSAYPDGFALLDWRDKFRSEVALYINEDWYRSSDYNCKPLPKYYALLGENA